VAQLSFTPSIETDEKYETLTNYVFSFLSLDWHTQKSTVLEKQSTIKYVFIIQLRSN